MSNYQGVPVIKLDESDHEEVTSSNDLVHIAGKEKEVQIIDLECPPKTGSSSKADSAKMNKDYDEHVPASKAITHQDDQERMIELRCTAARKLMGAVIFKDFGNMRMRGTVVDYDLENGWFKIRYQNYDEEEMSKEDVIQFVADPKSLHPYFDRLPASLSTHRPKKIKNLPCYQNKVAIIHASNRPIPPPLHPPTHQKRPRKRKQPTTYIPLAVKERKKDDYVWYK